MWKQTGTVLLVAALLAGCEKSPAAPDSTSNSQPPPRVTLKVHNATEGYKGDVTVSTDGSGHITIDSTDVSSKVQNGNLYPEVTVRYMPDADNPYVGKLKTVANATATFVPDADTYEVFFPNSANNTDYGCIAYVPDLKFGRKMTIGVLNDPGASGPMAIWTDAITELHNKGLIARDGRRYASMTFDPDATNPSMTVGFGFAIYGGSGWRLNDGRNVFLICIEDAFKIDYGRPTVKDTALAELWEGASGIDDPCGRGGTELIGLAIKTRDKQWGLSPEGIDHTTRLYVRTR